MMKFAKVVRDVARSVADDVCNPITNFRTPLVRAVWARARDAYLAGYTDGVRDALTASRELRPVGTHPNPIHASITTILKAWSSKIAAEARKRVTLAALARETPRPPVSRRHLSDGDQDSW